MTPKYRLRSIDPALAATMLERNTDNRNVRHLQVRKLAEAMSRGEFGLSNDAISFSDTGRLLNGQHRLLAVLRSGRTIEALVVEGLADESMRYLDTGRARTAGDYFGKAGLGCANAPALAAALRLLACIEDGGWGPTGHIGVNFTNGELEQVLMSHPSIEHSVQVALSSARQLDTFPRAVAVAHHLVAEMNGPDLADHYIQQIVSPVNEPKGSAVLAVDARLRQMSRSNQECGPLEVVEFLLRGWNRYAKGEAVRNMPFTTRTRSEGPPVIEIWREDTSVTGVA